MTLNRKLMRAKSFRIVIQALNFTVGQFPYFTFN